MLQFPWDEFESAILANLDYHSYHVRVTTWFKRPLNPSIYHLLIYSFSTYLFGEAIPSPIFVTTFETFYVSWLDGNN